MGSLGTDEMEEVAAVLGRNFHRLTETEVLELCVDILSYVHISIAFVTIM